VEPPDPHGGRARRFAEEALEEFATGEGISLSEAVMAMLRRAVHEVERDTDVPMQADYAIYDNAAEAILRSAHEAGASMIVIASHGHSGPSRWPLGSVAHKVLEAAPIPVLLVPARGATSDAQATESERRA
jgi:nucleotide-binding universal stress UspA family protein